jgi:hypothetical protein
LRYAIETDFGVEVAPGGFSTCYLRERAEDLARGVHLAPDEGVVRERLVPASPELETRGIHGIGLSGLTVPAMQCGERPMHVRKLDGRRQTVFGFRAGRGNPLEQLAVVALRRTSWISACGERP